MNDGNGGFPHFTRRKTTVRLKKSKIESQSARIGSPVQTATTSAENPPAKAGEIMTI